jgi:hypothetical protein
MAQRMDQFLFDIPMECETGLMVALSRDDLQGLLQECSSYVEHDIDRY